MNNLAKTTLAALSMAGAAVIIADIICKHIPVKSDRITRIDTVKVKSYKKNILSATGRKYAYEIDIIRSDGKEIGVKIKNEDVPACGIKTGIKGTLVYYEKYKRYTLCESVSVLIDYILDIEKEIIFPYINTLYNEGYQIVYEAY